MCQAGVEKVDQKAGDGRQGVRWMMFISGSRHTRTKQNRKEHQGNTTDDSTKTELNTELEEDEAQVE